jgi:hypothetical protein
MRGYGPEIAPPTLHRAPLTLPQSKFRGKYNSLEENKDCLKYPGYFERYVLEAPTDGTSTLANLDACAAVPPARPGQDRPPRRIKTT